MGSNANAFAFKYIAFAFKCAQHFFVAFAFALESKVFAFAFESKVFAFAFGKKYLQLLKK